MPDALIIAHGSPSDPAPQEAALMALAVRVAMWCPGWRIRGATLAAPGAVEAGVAALDDPLIYPFFMAEGFFTRTTLPKRLAAAGLTAPRQMAAFGHDAGLPDLIADAANRGAARAGLAPQAATLLIAAHGSQVSRASATITETVAQTLRGRDLFARIVTGYVEEEPKLEDAARALGPALCLPFFATRAGHVAGDVPDALAAAGFAGPLMPAIGEDAGVARLIAQALLAAA